MEVDNYNQSDLPTETQVEEEAKAVGRKTFGIVNVAGRESTKFILMALQFFFISFVYAVLRELKDAFTLKRQLPASIAFLKLAYVPPVSILVSAIIAKFLSVTSNQKMLLVLLAAYAFYFVAYGLFILPLQESLEPSVHFAGDIFSDSKMKFRGVESLCALLVTCTCWTSTLHFIMSEIWGSAVLCLLFMSFANDVCPFKQFIRFIPLFYIFSNVALMFSFGTIKGYEIIDKRLNFRQKEWALSGFFIFLAAITLLTCFIGIYLKNKVLNRPIFLVETDRKKKKAKVGFLEGVKLMFRSRLVLAICGMTLAYNIGTNLVEANYKSALGIYSKTTGKTQSEIMSFLAYQQVIVGFVVAVLLCTPFSRLIQIFGWTTMGLVAPITASFGFILVLCFALFNTSLAQENLGVFNNSIGKIENITEDKKASLMFAEIIIGLFVVSAFKITKYAAFDIAKETLSMRINKKYRARFKGIYDGVCGKLGKAGGSLICLICNSIMNSTDIRASSLLYLIIAGLLTVTWVFVIFYLGRAYQISVKNDCDVDIDLIGGKGSLDDDEEEIEQPVKQKKEVL